MFIEIYIKYNLPAKLNYKPNQSNRLFLSFYSGRDKILNKQKDHSGENYTMRNATIWGNYASSLRWNHIYGSKLFSNITLYFMNYKYKSSFKYSHGQNDSEYNANSELSSNISDIGLIADFEYYLFSKLKIKYGMNHTYHTYRPNNYEYSQGLSNADENVSAKNHSQSIAFENSLYTETEGSLFSCLSFNFGYRINSFSTANKTYINYEPRVVINANLPKIGSVKASYARMSQYVHLLIYFGTSMPADLWVPSTDIVPPRSAIYIPLVFSKKYLMAFSILALKPTTKNCTISLNLYPRIIYLTQQRTG